MDLAEVEVRARAALEDARRTGTLAVGLDEAPAHRPPQMANRRYRRHAEVAARQRHRTLLKMKGPE